jgi:hypothetical protein
MSSRLVLCVNRPRQRRYKQPKFKRDSKWVKGLRTLHHLVLTTNRHVPSPAGLAQRSSRQDQREFRQCRLGSQDYRRGAEPDRRAHNGEASPSLEVHHMCSTIFSLFVVSKFKNPSEK